MVSTTLAVHPMHRCCSLSLVILFSATVCASHVAPAHIAKRDGPAFANLAPLARGLHHTFSRGPISRRAPPAAVLGLRASMRDYQKSLVEDKLVGLEKLSQQIFNLQDVLLQIALVEEDKKERVVTGPPEPSPKHTAVIGTGPAGLATAIMLARYT